MSAFGGKQAFVNRRFQPLLPITANTLSIYYSIMCVFSQKILLRLIILCSHYSNKLNSVKAVLKSGVLYFECPSIKNQIKKL